MNKNKLLKLVETLRAAGQRRWHVGLEWDTWENCPKHPEGCSNPEHEEGACTCGADEHNAAVDAAAKALVAEIELLPDIACRKCRRTSCPHHGDFPRFAGPEHGCAAYQGGPA